MNAIASILAAVLALQEPAPPRCPPTDNACKAQQFEQRAKAEKSPQKRALYLHGAHLSYLALFDRTGNIEHLCAARRTFDQSMAIEEQPADQRASFEAVLPKLVAREKQHRARCSEVKKHRASREAPAVARVEPPASPPPPSQTEPARVVVAEFLEETPPPTEPAEPLLPVPPARALVERPMHDEEARPGRGLVIAGGVSLGVGLALTGAAGYLGGRMVETHREAQALGARVDGYADADHLAQDAALRRDYQRLGSQTLALALAGGATVIIGAVLVGVGGRRMARAASRMALVPVPAGLAFHARF